MRAANILNRNRVSRMRVHGYDEQRFVILIQKHEEPRNCAAPRSYTIQLSASVNGRRVLPYLMRYQDSPRAESTSMRIFSASGGAMPARAE